MHDVFFFVWDKCFIYTEQYQAFGRELAACARDVARGGDVRNEMEIVPLPEQV